MVLRTGCNSYEDRKHIFTHSVTSNQQRALIRELLDSRKASPLITQAVSDA